LSHLTDEQLIGQVGMRHRPALEELYDRYGKLVYSFAMKSTRDVQSTKEIVQAVFVRLWTTESGYDPGKGKFVNWLLTMTRNLTIDHVRKESKHRRTVPLDASAAPQTDGGHWSDPEASADRLLLREQLREAYRHLSPHQVQLLEQLYWQGYTLSEIAETNREPLGTVKSRLHQTLKILRKQLVAIREERY